MIMHTIIYSILSHVLTVIDKKPYCTLYNDCHGYNHKQFNSDHVQYTVSVLKVEYNSDRFILL